MGSELAACPVCGKAVFENHAEVFCEDELCVYMSATVEIHNTLARRAEIGRIVEAIVERTQFLTINDCNPTVVLVSTESGTESGSTLLDALRALEREVNDE